MPGIAEEYRIVAGSAGWIERAARGRVRFEGPDAASFLQALLSNDVLHVAQGRGVYATWLTPLGRMIADIEILRRGDAFLGLVADGMGPALAARFDQLIFSESVVVTDESSAWTEIAVTGARAAAIVAGALAIDSAALEALPELGLIEAGAALVIRGGDSPWPMFRILAPASDRDAIAAALAAHGAVPMTGDLADTLRVEARRPAWGRDLSTDTIPLEAGLLERAISTSKGCYVGQEIIIRILHRGGGRVARRLMLVVFDAATTDPIPAGTNLFLEGRAAGRVTTSVSSPAAGRVIALAYVQRDASEAGTTLQVEGSQATAIVQAAAS